MVYFHDNEWHTWCEKRYNEIALNWLSGSEPDSSDNEDLRLIAQSCLSDGGRAVLSARGLCEVWLKEHYKEEDCQSIAEKPRAVPAGVKEEKTSTLLVMPNHAGDMVNIQLKGEADSKTPLQIRILNLSGKEVYASTLPAESRNLSIPVGIWPNGMYIVRVGTLWSKTFIVQHK